MTVLLPALCLCFSLSAPARDRWTGEDKLRHFAASFVVTSMAASLARAAGADPVPSAWWGAAVGATAGISKELRDLRTGAGSASLADIAWDGAGVAAAVTMLRQAR